jgi:hypothetical protein
MNNQVMKYLVMNGMDTNLNRNLVRMGALQNEIQTLEKEISVATEQGESSTATVYQQLLDLATKELNNLMRKTS